MDVLGTLTQTIEAAKTMEPRLKAKFADIDESMRAPSLFFISVSLFWLLVGSLLAIIASIKLHTPNFLGEYEWLTFGRARAAHLNAVAFGWSNNAVFGVATWIMLRLSQIKLHNKVLLMTAGIFWNIAVAIGVCCILGGNMNAVEWLEMPKGLSPMLASSYLLIGVWGIVSFKYRQTSHVYVSQWYILGALFWFPWIYTAVQAMVIWFPARGTVQSITNWWFAHNVLGLWYTPVGIATAYYLIPKVLGKPIHSYYLSVVGFWTLALFYNWAGVHHLIGGPIPIWIVSTAIVASVMMVIPVVVTAINHHMTVVGSFGKVWRSPTLRFVVFGVMSYTLASALGSAMALREVNVVTHFTHFTVGHAHHGAYAFFTMVMFGAMYYMLPRLVKKEWPSKSLIKAHFWLCGLGITIYVIGLSIGGWIQGLEMNNAEIPFIETVKHSVKYLLFRSVGGSMMGLGHLVFAIHFIWFLARKCNRKGPTLLGSKEEVLE